MGSFSNFWENEVLDHLFMKGSYAMPSNLWIGLSTADPTDDNSGQAEPSGNNYSRVSTSGADWDVSVGGATANATAIAFPTASGSWGTVTHFCIWDALSGGNMLAHGVLTVPRIIGSEDTASFHIGDLDVTLD